MKRSPLPLLVFLAATAAAPAFAQNPAPASAQAQALSLQPLASTRSVEHSWSAVGTWDCTQRDWSGTVVLKEDGSLQGPSDPLSGRWLLAPQGGEINLILYWNDWPAEVVAMVGPDEFLGNPVRGNLRMRRHPALPAIRTGSPAVGFGEVETRTWSQGEPPVRLIRKDEGFCALTKITGNFEGGGESVQVHVAEDGYWYLDGTSQQEGVGAECLVVRYRK